MRPFTIYSTIRESFLDQQEKLVSMILEVVSPDRIYLLGASLSKRCSESIFCTEAPSSKHCSDYYFLVLMDRLTKKADNKQADKTAYELQDQIEQYCSTVLPVTTIVLQSSIFKDWLSKSHAFACKVYHSAICLYDSKKISFVPGEQSCHQDTTAEETKTHEKVYQAGINRSREFMAGVELFALRKQYGMAAFMLHQSAEQALHSLIKIGTGFHSPTHNLERLLRYGGLVCYQMADIFPNKTEKEKRLFSLLKNAYSDARYSRDYSINAADLLILRDKVRRIQELLELTAKEKFNHLSMSETD